MSASNPWFDRLPPSDRTLPPDQAVDFPPTMSGATVGPSLSEGKPGSGNAAVVVPGYEILSELGRGGMGVVYQARHLQLNRIVALKMVLAAGHTGSDERARFLGEAEAVAALQHPNIVQVFDFGKHDNLPYMALEYVNGGSLAANRGTRCPYGRLTQATLAHRSIS